MYACHQALSLKNTMNRFRENFKNTIFGGENDSLPPICTCHEFCFKIESRHFYALFNDWQEVTFQKNGTNRLEINASVNFEPENTSSPLN